MLVFSGVEIQACLLAALWISRAALVNKSASTACTAVSELHSVGAAGLATCTVVGTAVMSVGATVLSVVGFGTGWWSGRRKQTSAQQ